MKDTRKAGAVIFLRRVSNTRVVVPVVAFYSKERQIFNPFRNKKDTRVVKVE